jgi:hypothetical protein
MANVGNYTIFAYNFPSPTEEDNCIFFSAVRAFAELSNGHFREVIKIMFCCKKDTIFPSSEQIEIHLTIIFSVNKLGSFRREINLENFCSDRSDYNKLFSPLATTTVRKPFCST